MCSLSPVVLAVWLSHCWTATALACRVEDLCVPSLHHAAAGEWEPQRQWQVISVSHEGVTISFRALITRLLNGSAHNNTSFVKPKHNVISTVNTNRTWINNFDWIVINNTLIYLCGNLSNFGSYSIFQKCLCNFDFCYPCCCSGVAGGGVGQAMDLVSSLWLAQTHSPSHNAALSPTQSVFDSVQAGHCHRTQADVNP